MVSMRKGVGGTGGKLGPCERTKYRTIMPPPHGWRRQSVDRNVNTVSSQSVKFTTAAMFRRPATSAAGRAAGPERDR